MHIVSCRCTVAKIIFTKINLVFIVWFTKFLLLRKFGAIQYTVPIIERELDATSCDIESHAITKRLTALVKYYIHTQQVYHRKCWIGFSLCPRLRRFMHGENSLSRIVGKWDAYANSGCQALLDWFVIRTWIPGYMHWFMYQAYDRQRDPCGGSACTDKTSLASFSLYSLTLNRSLPC